MIGCGLSPPVRIGQFAHFPPKPGDMSIVVGGTTSANSRAVNVSPFSAGPLAAKFVVVTFAASTPDCPAVIFSVTVAFVMPAHPLDPARRQERGDRRHAEAG